MQTLRELGLEGARWLGAVRGRRRFELRSADGCLSRLHWERWDGRLALVETAESRWLLRSSGRDDVRIDVLDVDSDRDVASYRGDWRGQGFLRCEDGSAYGWSGANLWMTRWLFRTATGRPAVEFQVDSARLVPSAVVTFGPAHLRSADSLLLASLGWHLAVRTLELDVALAAMEAGAD